MAPGNDNDVDRFLTLHFAVKVTRSEWFHDRLTRRDSLRIGADAVRSRDRGPGMRSVGAWRSLVAHLPWAQGVAGSNPVAPTISASSSVGLEQRPSKPRVMGSNPFWRAISERGLDSGKVGEDLARVGAVQFFGLYWSSARVRLEFDLAW
jgi:hypothetical protein